MEKVKRPYVSWQVNDLLNTWNDLFINLIYDLPFNSPVFVFYKRNTGQSGSLNSPYKPLNIQNKWSIIKLSSSPTQFYLTSVKLYHHRIIKTNDNYNKNTKDISLENCDNPKYQKILSTHLLLDIQPTLVLLTSLISLIPVSTLSSILPTLAKCRHRKSWKHPMQTNFLILSDICFVMDNLYYNDVNMRLPLSILLR